MSRFLVKGLSLIELKSFEVGFLGCWQSWALNRCLIYLACTTYPGIETNEDKVTGKHRRLNMSSSPFEWPQPKLLRDEEECHCKA